MHKLPIRTILGLSVVALVACSERTTESQPAPEFATAPARVSRDSLEAHVLYLASDELGGRAPGSRGEELTLAYLSEQYSGLGLRPGNPNGMYVQEVPLVGRTMTNAPSLVVDTGNGIEELVYGKDFVGWTPRSEPRVTVADAELVFVGYGVVAPEYGWDDYKGVDVHDKVILVLVGDPPLADSTLFGGRAMTYYGRWTYKFEIAAEKGAVGAVIVHNTNAAGYPWEVVANSWSGEQFDVARSDGGGSRCRLESWITETAAERLLARSGLALADAYASALTAAFEPMPLGMRCSATIESESRRIKSANVVARIDGADPDYRDEVVIYTAHWDHLGTGNTVDGDSIYNGALDNASGVAATLELARLCMAHKTYLRRSILIINTTAEESGLLGADYYASHPLVPIDKTVATINIDGLNVWGRTHDMVVVGFGQSTLDDYLERAIRSQERRIKPDAEPEKGYYYRSDHLPFAKKGVPSLYADSGIDYVGRPKSWGTQAKQAYTRERYHKPQDEFDGAWDWTGAIQDIEAYFRVGMMLAASTDYPEWSEQSEFNPRKPSREASH